LAFFSISFCARDGMSGLVFSPGGPIGGTEGRWVDEKGCRTRINKSKTTGVNVERTMDLAKSKRQHRLYALVCAGNGALGLL